MSVADEINRFPKLKTTLLSFIGSVFNMRRCLLVVLCVGSAVIITRTIRQLNQVCKDLEQKARICCQCESPPTRISERYDFDLRICDQSPVDFTGFDNETGTPDGRYIVPNVIHFIRFTAEPISYVHMICYLAALKNQRPNKIYIHYDDAKTFSGKYWEILKNTPAFNDILEKHQVEMPKEIFGQKINEEWRKFHGSDITRIRVLLQYGGIFLDNDSYLVRCLNDFRRYEMVIGWDDKGQFIGTQVIVAHKNARFLKLWLETYNGNYRHNEWYYNAGERPTVEVLYKSPDLVHRVIYLFGVHNKLKKNLYEEYWPEWRFMYTIHLLHRHIQQVYDEKNVLIQGNTFREMALDIYNPDNASFQYKSWQSD